MAPKMKTYVRKCIGHTVFSIFLCDYRLTHFLLQKVFRELCWNCGRNHLQFVVWNARYFYCILMEIEICGQFSVQLPYIKFNQNLPVDWPTVTHRQTDRHDEAKRQIIFATLRTFRMEHKYHLCVRHTDEPSSVASAKYRTYSPASCSDLALILRSDTVPPPSPAA